MSSGAWWKQISLDLFDWWALGVKCSFHVLLELVVSAESKLIQTQRSELLFVGFESGYSAFFLYCVRDGRFLYYFFFLEYCRIWSLHSFSFLQHVDLTEFAM